MLGALKCTPTSCLETEASLIPLHLLRRESMIKYAARILAIENHLFRILLRNYYPFKFYRHIKEPLPISGRVYGEFQKIEITFNDAKCVPISARYCCYNLQCYSTLHKFNKFALNCSHWQALFADLMATKYHDYTSVFCDDSVRGERSGGGMFSSAFKLKIRLRDNCSILIAELSAILFALEFISRQPCKYLIITDSLSLISLINQSNSTKNYLSNKIIHKILSLTSHNIAIEWVPSHVGIDGNERAKKLAREALELTVCIKGIPLYDMRRIMTQYYHRIWQREWCTSSNIHTLMKPTVEESIDTFLTCREQICLTRLRFKLCLFTHKHLFTGSPPARCSTCSGALTVQHVLIDCPLFSAARAEILKACTYLKIQPVLTNILANNFSVPVLCSFLRKIGYLENIQALRMDC